MCGRFSLEAPIESLKERFDAILKVSVQPRFNIAPGQQSAIITSELPREIVMARWGLIPHWAKDPKIAYKTINARVEGIESKPAYREAFKKHHCLVLADSFYEWKKTGEAKQPFRIMRKDGAPFAFAGLCSSWQNPNGKNVLTFTIITGTPNSLVKEIHGRSPIILEEKSEQLWLKDDLSIQDSLELLSVFPASKMKAYPISTLVNSPRNDVPEVTQPLR